jgi:16S rRNA (uracil1498-N3)-methyltransferase
VDNGLLRQAIETATALGPGEEIRLTGLQRERLRYREVRGGASFTLRDGRGHYFRARVSRYDEEGADCFVFERMPRSPEPPLRMTLVQAVPTRERMFWVIEKATELGVDRIVPVLSARSVRPEDLAKEKPHRWPEAAMRAVRQCRRARVPEVTPPLTLEEALVLPAWRDAELRWALAGTEADSPTVKEGKTPLVAALAVGPEGGWTAREEELLVTAGGVRVGLTGRVLRAETAALVGLTALLARYGDL